MTKEAYEIKTRTMKECSNYVDDAGGKYVCGVATIMMRPLQKPAIKTSGGIVVPDHFTGKGADGAIDTTVDALRHGVVEACGVYQQRNGEIVWDFPGWPLPVGTLVEHIVRNPHTTKTTDGVIESITCDNARRWYLPGNWPRWAVEQQKRLAGDR